MKLGSVKRKNTSQLRTAAPNNDWFRNVIKSVGYATADIVKETIPSAFEFTESNGKDAMQLYTDLRQDGPKSVTKMLAESMEKNAYMKIASDAISNTRDDIKTGKFYNREREERAVLGDDDFTFGDGEEFDFSFDENEFDEFEDTGDSKLSEAPKVTNVKKVTVNNINANITKNNPMVQSINKQSEVILASTEATNRVNTALATTNFTLTSKVASDMMTGMSTINDNLSALVNFNNDSMSKYVAASLQYYSDSLSVLNNTLEHMKNSGTEDVKEQKEQIDPFLSNGGLNVKSYTQLLKKNMNNVIQDDLMLNSLYSFASDTDTIKMLAASPLKLIPKMVSKVIVPTIVRESAAEFDKSFANFFPALLNKFNKMADSDNWFLSKVGQLFGFKPKNKTGVDVSMYNKGDINFNGITQKAITEVIPTYLRKILSAINGKNEMLFDYQTGKFTDYMSAVDERDKTVKNKSLGSMEVYSDLKSRLDAIRFTDEEDKKAMFTEFEDFMFKLSKSNGINPHVRTVKGETVDELKDLYSGQFAEIFRSALFSLNKSDMMKLMGNDIFSAKGAVSQYYDEAQNNIGASILPVLEAWNSKDEYTKEKDGSYKRKDPLASISIDKFGKTSLDYMREMRNLMVEGIIVFPKGGCFRGKGGRPSNSSSEAEIYRNRRNRLTEISEEAGKVNKKEQESKVHQVKSYTEEERRKLKARGVVVADGITDLTMDSNAAQLTDIFKTYVQNKDGDGKASNQLDSAGGWVKKIFSKGSKKANNMRDMFDNIFSMPSRVLSNVFNELDNGLYKLIFGVNQDGSDQSFLSKVVTSIKSEFSTFFNWTKETFFTPLHDALLGDNGVLTKMKNSQAMQSLKNVGKKMGDWAFGNLDESGHRRDGALSEAYNDLKDMTNDVRRTLTGKGYTDRFGNVHDKETNSVFGNVNSAMNTVYQNGKLYLFGNKKDQYVDSPMLMPTAFGTNPIIGGQNTQLDPIQNMYSVESAEKLAAKASRPVIRLADADIYKPQSGITSPFLQSYLDNNGLTGNGGQNIMDWIKDNLQLQYSVDVNGKKGNTKTVGVGENVSETIGSGGMSPMMVNGFPYFSQRDPRYANTVYNLSTGKGGGGSIAFGDRGCGPAAMSMVANGLGQNVDPTQMADIATEGGYSVEGGTKGSFFNSIGEKLGFSSKEKQTSSSQVESAIIQGKPMIFRGRKTTDNMTPFTTDGHFVVGVGGKNGKVQINDPNGIETSGEYNIKDIVSESNKMWTFDDTGKGSDFNPTGPKYDVVVQKKKKDKYITDWSRKASGDGSGEIRGAVTELSDGFREASAEMMALVFGEKAGEEDKESRTKKFSDKFRQMLPKGISGGILGGGLGAVVGATGGMGLMGSFFLPGGPIGGAILGTALGFATQSDKFKEWAFGKEDPEDSSKRIGGFISQKTQKFFRDHKTTIIGGAALGGLKGVIGGTGIVGSMLFGGPLTGALMGAGVGLAVRSEKFQETVFGKLDEESGKKIGGMLSGSYNKVVDNKKLIAGAGVGLLGGMGVGALMSSMGILGSSFFLGPVGGAIAGAGMGIAVASEKWRDKVFGTFNDEKGKREGGLMDEVKTAIKYEIMAPLKEKMAETTLDMKYWFQESIMLPISNAFEPFKKVTGMIAEDIMYNFRAITQSIGDTFNKYVGEPLQQFMHEKIFNPLQKTMSKMFDMTMSVTKTILGAPFKLLDGVSWLGAKMVQNKTQKRQAKSQKASGAMAQFEETMMDRDLNEKEQKKYDKLKRRRDRFFVGEDDERLTFFDTWKDRKDSQKDAIRKEGEAKKKAFARLKDYNKERREFIKIFGEDVPFDAKLLADYKSIAERESGKQIKGKKNKKAVRMQQEEFLKQFHDNRANSKGAEVVAPDVAKIKDTLSDNLSPIRGSLYNIENTLVKWFKKLEAKSFMGIDGIKGDDTGQGGRRDASWIMTGKGGEEKGKKKGIFSSFGNTMVSALKKFDKHNDAEEDKKAKNKEAKAELSDKQKSVSSKSYANLSQDLRAKAKEEEERTFKDKLLAAVEGIKTTTGDHKVGWDSIFSKKGLLTGALLLALPAFAKFLDDPAKAIGDLIGSVMNGITVSIGWLFGKNNGQRTDAQDKQVTNTGLVDSSGRLIRNTTKKVVSSDVVQKGARLASRLGKGVYNTVTDTKNIFTLSENARLLAKEGVKGADELVEFGVRNVDDLLELGVKSTADLSALGIKSSDDLAKLGVKTAEDLSNKKSTSQLAKLRMKTTDEFVETGLLSSTAVKKTVNQSVSDGASKVAAKATTMKNAVVSTTVESANKVMNTKFVSTILDWLNAAFTNNKVVKKLGSEAAQNTLRELTEKVTKALTGSVLDKFAKKISIALAEVTGRIAAGTTTAGIATVAFGVADFVSGAVNAERLFEIPPGTATVGMRTMSAVLQTILGIGMIGPLIDVANEIIAEVTGFNFLSMIATTGYSWITQATDGDVKLKNLQAEFTEDYEMYKEGNGLENFSKRAYQDVVNPSFGTKVMDKTKQFGNALSGNFFNGNEIRNTLGKDENYKVSVGDRFSELTGNLVQGVTFGKVNGDELIRKMAGGLDSSEAWISDKWDKTKQGASQLWDNTKSWGTDTWNNTKDWASNSWDKTKQGASQLWNNTKDVSAKAWDATKQGVKQTGHFMSGNMFNDDEIRAQLGLKEGVDLKMKDRLSMGASSLIETLTFGKVKSEDTIETIYGYQTMIADSAKNMWETTKNMATTAWDNTKESVSATLDATGKRITGTFGLFDESGEPLPFGEGVKLIKDRTIEGIKGTWNDVKNGANAAWNNTKETTSQYWSNFKGWLSDGTTALGKNVTGMLGLYDENGEPLPFGEGMSLAKDNIVNSVSQTWSNIKTGANEWWTNTKDTLATSWSDFKTGTVEGISKLNTHLGGVLGFQNENGDSVSLTEGVSLGMDKFLTGIKDSWTNIKDGATEFWDSAKTTFSENFTKFKDNLSKGMDELNKGLGRLMGFEDANGNPMSLTSAVKDGWSKTVTIANDLWSSFEDWIGVDKAKDTARTDISNRNAGYGGFGGEAIPMNIGGRGCGPTAMAMVTSKMTGQQVDPVSMSNLATQGGFAGQYGTNGNYFKYAANQYGIHASEGKTTSENLTRALSSGQPVILRGQSNGAASSAFTRSGHYVVAVGQKDGRVIINDPRGVNYSGAYDMNDVVSQSNVMWSFGNKQGPYGVDVPPVILGGTSSDVIPGELIYKYAAAHVGKPYVWGDEGPNSFDCSGLVNYAAKQAGVKLPSSRPTAATWKSHCKSITRDQLMVGDLGFYRQGGSITHVAIYAGDGQWCHAEGGSGPKGQGGKVKVNSPTYLNEFGRIPGVSGTSTQYVGNAVQTGGRSSGGALADITGFISSLGKSAINSAITGEAPQFMSFSDYMAGSETNAGPSYMNTPYSGETISLGSRKTDANTLNKYLGGKLANKGATIIRAGQEYGVDPAFVASILHHESANGTSNAIVNYNNPGGIMDPKTKWTKLKRFSSLDAGIDYTASNLKSNYLDKGLKSIPEIGNKYAPVGAANDHKNQNTHWVPNVSKLYNQYSFDGMGGFGECDTEGCAVNHDKIRGYTSFLSGDDTSNKPSYTFTDRTSKIGMGETYVKSMVQSQIKDTSGTDVVSNILEKVLDVLSRIADNTGVTSKNIKDAITTVMTSSTNTAVTNVNNINGTNSTTKRSVNTNSQYSESEMRNRSVAQQIAQGRFV